MAASLAVLHGATAYGQSVGDKVTPKKAVELKVKDRVVTIANPKDVLTVEKTNDDWVWVKTDSSQRGWVQKIDVKAVEATGPTAPDSPESAPAEPVDDRLYLIGAMGATEVYLTYAYIGAVGDGFVKETYDAQKVNELMTEVGRMTDHLITQLKKVRDGELTDEDRKAIDQMIEINELLHKQSQSLIAYSESQTVETAQSFDEVRKAVWPKISTLLGIKAAEGAVEGTPTPPAAEVDATESESK
jgi:hypothetical protein